MAAVRRTTRARSSGACHGSVSCTVSAVLKRSNDTVRRNRVACGRALTSAAQSPASASRPVRSSFAIRGGDHRRRRPARRVETVDRQREPLGEISFPPHPPGRLHNQLPRQDPGGRRLPLPRGQDPARGRWTDAVSAAVPPRSHGARTRAAHRSRCPRLRGAGAGPPATGLPQT